MFAFKFANRPTRRQSRPASVEAPAFGEHQQRQKKIARDRSEAFEGRFDHFALVFKRG